MSKDKDRYDPHTTFVDTAALAQEEAIDKWLKAVGPASVSKSFMKNDGGKNMISLIDPKFIMGLGEVLTFGAAKYAKNNWKLCEDADRYKDALLRHLYAYLDGEKIDPESGLSHLSHAAFGLMALQYFDAKEESEQ